MKFPNLDRCEKWRSDKARRITRDLSASELERLKEALEQVARELPDLIARDKRCKEASEEATLSGELRRAIHASDLSLSNIATRAGITLVMLDDFLTGGQPVPSDAMDRLANILGYQLKQVS